MRPALPPTGRAHPRRLRPRLPDPLRPGVRRSLRRLGTALAAAILGAAALATTQPVSAAPTPHQQPVRPAATNGSNLALTPPMGFNDWAGFECNDQMNQQLFVDTADRIVSLGLDKLGYTYVNIDDCWMQHDRDSAGNLQVDTTRFPHGMS